VALIAPIFVVITFAIAMGKRAKKIESLADATMKHMILQNFSQKAWNVKVALCIVISLLYAFAMAGACISDGVTVKIDAVPHLLQILILTLALEDGITTRKLSVDTEPMDSKEGKMGKPRK
jgi:hypothetical protein